MMPFKHKPFIVLLFLCCLFGTSIQGQTVYELAYEFPVAGKMNPYSAFFSLNSNGTGIVRYKDLKAGSLAEMEILEQYAVRPDGSADTTLLLYEGLNPKKIAGSAKYIPVVFSYWFKLDSTGQYQPWAVTEKAGVPIPLAPNISRAVFYQPELLARNKPFILNYFDSTSSYYTNIFYPNPKGTKGVIPWFESKKPRLFMLVVASTRDSSLMPNCQTDARRMVDMFTDIGENELGIPVLVDSVYGSRYNKATVEAAVNRLKPGPDDIVVFYYSGHGFRDQTIPNKEFPFLDLRDPNNRPRPKPQAQTMNIQDIYQSIVQKGARLNLVLSDCCNDTVEAKKPKSPVSPPASRAPMKYNKNNLIALFLTKNKMNFLMTAASRDERAIITPRYSSYFTYFFIESLRSYLGPAKGNPTWFQVLEDTKKQTTLYAGKVPCPNGNKCQQTPKLFLPR